MSVSWVTVDKFTELTGINRDYALRRCRSGEWQENIAWRKLSDKIYLISLVWWDTWQETAAASKRRQDQALKSSFNMKASDVESASNASPRLPILEN